MSLSFHPPQRTLLGPGPSDVNPRILEALSRPTIGHLDPVIILKSNYTFRRIQFIRVIKTEKNVTLVIFYF